MPGSGAGRRSGLQYAGFLQSPRRRCDAVGPPPAATAPPSTALTSAPPAGAAPLSAPAPLVARLEQLQPGIPLVLDGLFAGLARPGARLLLRLHFEFYCSIPRWDSRRRPGQDVHIFCGKLRPGPGHSHHKCIQLSTPQPQFVAGVVSSDGAGGCAGPPTAQQRAESHPASQPPSPPAIGGQSFGRKKGHFV